MVVFASAELFHSKQADQVAGYVRAKEHLGRHSAVVVKLLDVFVNCSKLFHLPGLLARIAFVDRHRISAVGAHRRLVGSNADRKHWDKDVTRRNKICCFLPS